MSKDDFVYTGCDNLEAMTEAVNYNKFLMSLITRQLPVGKHPKVLDFGAGSGTYAKMLRKQGVTPDCLEPDKALQKVLAKDGFSAMPDASVLKPNTYDLIYALNVFEHIEDDFEAAKQLHAALKKGGKLLIYVPAFQVLFSSMDHTVGHYRRYRAGRLQEIAKAAGLHAKEVVYYDPAGFFAALVYKMGRGKGVLSPQSVRIYDAMVFPVSKALHPLSKRVFGKNVILVAEK